MVAKKEETKAEKVDVKAPEKAEPKVETKAEKVEVEIPKGNFIMKVTYLTWGKDGKNSFYAKKKPEINAKVMKEYASTLLVWLEAGWIEKGSYE